MIFADRLRLHIFEAPPCYPKEGVQILDDRLISIRSLIFAICIGMPELHSNSEFIFLKKAKAIKPPANDKGEDI